MDEQQNKIALYLYFYLLSKLHMHAVIDGLIYIGLRGLAHQTTNFCGTFSTTHYLPASQQPVSRLESWCSYHVEETVEAYSVPFPFTEVVDFETCICMPVNKG